jgi:hypothetical protein
MAKRHYVSDGAYAGEASRKRMEKEDGGMISDDMSAVANLPQEVMYKPWPSQDMYMPEDLRDDIRSVDEQMNMDNRKRKEHNMPKKV